MASNYVAYCHHLFIIIIGFLASFRKQQVGSIEILISLILLMFFGKQTTELDNLTILGSPQPPRDSFLTN